MSDSKHMSPKKPALAWFAGMGDRQYIVSADTAHNACLKAVKHDKMLMAIGCEAEPIKDIEGNHLCTMSILD